MFYSEPLISRTRSAKKTVVQLISIKEYFMIIFAIYLPPSYTKKTLETDWIGIVIFLRGGGENPNFHFVKIFFSVIFLYH